MILLLTVINYSVLTSRIVYRSGMGWSRTAANETAEAVTWDTSVSRFSR